MALETLTGELYVDALDPTNPDGADFKNKGDDHLRGIKNVVERTLASVNFPVSGYLVDGGAVDALTASLSPAPTALVTGMEVYIKAANTVTGASTLNLNGIAAKAIKLPSGLDTIAGDIIAGQICHFRYDGTNFQLLNPIVFTKELVQANTYNYAVGTGTADVQAATYTPAPAAYAAGQIFWFKAVATNTGACTFNVNGLGAKSIKLQDGNDPIAGDITASGIYGLAYDGTNFVLVSMLGNTPVYIGSDKNVKVTSVDTTSDYLNNKITVSGSAVKSITSPGGDEKLNIDVPAVTLTDYAIKSGAYTAVAGDQLAVDTSGGAVTITLPATPTVLTDRVDFVDLTGDFATNNLTVARNGSNIMGLAEDMIVATDNISFGLVYMDATNGWILV